MVLTICVQVRPPCGTVTIASTSPSSRAEAVPTGQELPLRLPSSPGTAVHSASVNWPSLGVHRRGIVFVLSSLAYFTRDDVFKVCIRILCILRDE